MVTVSYFTTQQVQQRSHLPYGDGRSSTILSFSGYASVIVLDSYGNPISNLPVDFEAQPALPQGGCLNPNQKTAKLVKTNDTCLTSGPVWDDPCSTANTHISEITDSAGAAVNTILGQIPAAKYPIKATCTDAKCIDQTTQQPRSATFNHYTADFGNCGSDGLEVPDAMLALKTTETTDASGHIINAGKSGTSIPVSAKIYYLKEGDRTITYIYSCGLVCDRIIGTQTYSIDTAFTTAGITFSGNAGVPQGSGIYSTDYTLKPGVNTITIDATADTTVKRTHNACPNYCTPPDQTTEPLSASVSMTKTVYGVDITLNTIPTILVDQWGYAAADYPITYSISPAEYQALSAYVLIYKNGTVISTIPAGTKGTGTATISRGFWFDINSTYEAEVVLNKSTGVEIRSIKRSLPLDIQVKIITPPDNPNPSDSTFTTNYSYLSDSTVNAEATVGQIGNAAEISWDVTATLGGIWNENPANRMGPTFIFSLNPPAHPPYVQGTGCNDAGNGSCDRSNPLSYRIKAIYHSGSDENTITQDQLDIIRQEYVNHGLAVPIRGDFQVPYSTAHFTVAEIIGNNAYSVVLGTPGEFAEIIRDAYNRLINDDVQEIPVGTSGLDPLHIVVSPGANIQTIGPVLDTAPCNGAPNPTVCDDKYGILEEDGFMKDVIIAGPNGIAETVAVNQLTDYGLRISSAWRNPERNEAIGGVLTSRHQYGNADDLQHRNDASGKTSAQLYCILLTAAKGVANYAIAEQGATERACNDPLVDHIHAHN